MYKSFLKSLIDRAIALVLLIIAFPILLLVSLLLLIANQGKIFFFQMRPGLRGKPFKIVKFKTMTDKTDKEGNLLPDAERLTSIGTFVRKTSLDELPQLLNVLKGDISLVGPRPLLMEYLPLYSPIQAKRHEVKPGITGWAQVNGRNAISWTKKFELDVYYVEHLSFALDIKILYQTALNVLRSKDINSQTAATMEKFTGSAEKE